jgi:hypothetical protein
MSRWGSPANCAYAPELQKRRNVIRFMPKHRCGFFISCPPSSTRTYGYRRWLGFPKANYPDDLSKPPAERITPEPLLQLPFIEPTATLTVPSLLSGTPKRQRDKTAKGGLLRKLGAFGILVLKDFGSILSMHPEAKAEVLQALREVFDGAWTRHLGSDGGRTLSWVVMGGQARPDLRRDRSL